MAKLSSWQRRRLPPSAFAIPERREYPYRYLPGGHENNVSHARNALSRSSGKPEEGRVRRAVERQYPEIGEEE